MLNNGEFKSVRTTTNHPKTTDQGQQDYDGPAQCAEPTELEAATRRAASIAGAARTLPGPVTPAERAEQRLGFAMMEESFNNDRIPKPLHWIKAQGLGDAFVVE